jgi:hypothetical protein
MGPRATIKILWEEKISYTYQASNTAPFIPSLAAIPTSPPRFIFLVKKFYISIFNCPLPVVAELKVEVYFYMSAVSCFSLQRETVKLHNFRNTVTIIWRPYIKWRLYFPYLTCLCQHIFIIYLIESVILRNLAVTSLINIRLPPPKYLHPWWWTSSIKSKMHFTFLVKNNLFSSTLLKRGVWNCYDSAKTNLNPSKGWNDEEASLIHSVPRITYSYHICCL